jgi:CRISPR system Cascade subunit CasE
VEANERYRELLEQTHPPIKLFDLALKAAADSALETWLTERGKTNGFIVVRGDKRKILKFQAEGYRWHALPSKGRFAGFSSVDFDGEVELTDHNLFINALFTGIGPAKAFGCGLMLVRRV